MRACSRRLYVRWPASQAAQPVLGTQRLRRAGCGTNVTQRLKREDVAPLPALPAVREPTQRREAGAMTRDECGVEGTGRGPHQQVGENLPFGEGLQDPDLDGAHAPAA